MILAVAGMSNGCHWGQYKVKLARELKRDGVIKVSKEVLRRK